jgi:hypothetical protein
MLPWRLRGEALHGQTPDLLKRVVSGLHQVPRSPLHGVEPAPREAHQNQAPGARSCVSVWRGSRRSPSPTGSRDRRKDGTGRSSSPSSCRASGRSGRRVDRPTSSGAAKRREGELRLCGLPFADRARQGLLEHGRRSASSLRCGWVLLGQLGYVPQPGRDPARLGGFSVRQIADHLGHAQRSMTQDVYLGRRMVESGAADVVSRFVPTVPSVTPSPGTLGGRSRQAVRGTDKRDWTETDSHPGG